MKTLVLLSGGIDSTTVLATMLDKGRECAALAFNYGQRHARELASAKAVAEHYGTPLEIINLTGAFSGNSALLGGKEVPAGVYTQESLSATVVPGRNLTFLAIAASRAEVGGFDEIAIGCHAGDHAVYPDCTPGFVAAAGAAIHHSSGVSLVAPFLLDSKRDIVLLGLALGVPYELTYSCYQGGDEPCGECSTCREREGALCASS